MPGNGPNGDNPKKDALNLMKQGKYQKALSKLDQVQDEKNRNWVNLNKGICLHYLQKDTEAKKRFDYVITKSTEKYHIGLAHFYLEEYLLSLYFFYEKYYKDSNRQFVSFRIGSTYLELLEQLRKYKDEAIQGKNGKYLYKWLEELEETEYSRKIKYFYVTSLKNSGEPNDKINKLISFYESFEELNSDLLSLKNSGESKDKRDKVIAFYEKWVSRVNHNAMEFLSDGISPEDGDSGLTCLGEIKKFLSDWISPKDGDKSVFLYNKGVALSNIGKDQEAILTFGKAVRCYPEYALALNNKGNTYVKMERYGDAIKAYTKAIKINSEYSIAYNNRGQVYFNLKSYKKALKDFGKAIESNSLNYNAWTNKGAVFFYQKEYGRAKEAFEKALELNPDYALANVYLAKILLYLGNSVLSYEKINKALDFDVRNADAWRLKGQLLLKDKKYEEAIESFDHAFQYSKGDPSLVLWKAYARYLKVLDLEAISSENKEEKPQVVWSRETKSLDDRVADLSKKVINSLPLKSNNFQSSNKSSDKKEKEGSKFKNESYSIIRELEMYFSICCKGKEITSHVVLDMLMDLSFWVKKNIELLFLPIFRYFLIRFTSFKISENYLKSINSTLENYELENIKSYVLYLLGCLYYKEGDYFEAKNHLEECIKHGPKDIKKSASQILDHISANYIQSPWWTWWLSSPTSSWTKRIIFTFLSGGFIVLLLFHPYIYSILFKFIYLSQFKDFFTEKNVTSYMTNNTTNINENIDKSFNSIQYSTLNKSNEIFTNFDPFTINNVLYYVLASIPIFILFSPHISKLTFKATPVEIETKSPKDFEFILHPCLMDDVVRKIDDIPSN